jgi:hypothetical protein
VTVGPLGLGAFDVIGYCSGCGALGEVDLLPVANGGQRLLCTGCRDGWGPPRLPGPERFRLLVDRLREGSLSPSEERDLRFALEGILDRTRDRSEPARVLLEDLMQASSMNRYRPRRT